MLALALLLFAGSAPAAHREAATATLLKGLVGDGEPGLAVLVRRDGRTVLERGYGVRDLRARKPIDPRTCFRLASVTKQMTAAAVMLLVRDGRLRYEDTLPRALPGFPAYGNGITIRHLLTHTSGLPDYEQLMESVEKEKGPIWTPERQIRDDEVLALLEKEERGLFAPGTRWAYSNSSYVLLGLVAARAAGKPFGDVLRERIFAPLGMTRTLAYEKGRNEVARPCVRPYERGQRLPRDRPELDLGHPRRRWRLLVPGRPGEVGRGAADERAPVRGRDGTGAHADAAGRRVRADRLRLRLVSGPVARTEAGLAPRRDDGLPVDRRAVPGRRRDRRRPRESW